MMIVSGLFLGAEQLPESNKMKPDHAPTPFSAAQIRDNCAGRTVKLRQEVTGKPVVFVVFEFRQGDAEHADLDAYNLDKDGKLIGEKHSSKPKWTELQAHASFPAANTKLVSETKTTPLGTLDCWHYTVTTKKEDKTQVDKYWFAKTLPGPPVMLTQTLDGKTVLKMTMIESKH
jgi:hypothetical protein